jgi:uncharacterized protein YcnI
VGTVLVIIAAVIGIASPAWAHVTIEPSQASKGSDAVLALRPSRFDVTVCAIETDSGFAAQGSRMEQGSHSGYFRSCKPPAPSS